LLDRIMRLLWSFLGLSLMGRKSLIAKLTAKHLPYRPMSQDAKRFWKIVAYDGSHKLFEKVLPLGSLSEGEMTTLLQRLAARSLSPDEIISASLRPDSKSYAPLLEAQQQSRPAASRFYISVGTAQNCVASVWNADELASELSDGA
jgi:hypothetical protein